MSDPIFFPAFEPVAIEEIANWVDAVFDKNASEERVVSSVASLSRAQLGDLVFLEGRKNVALLDNLSATAILITDGLAENVPSGIAVLKVKSPSLAFARVIQKLYPMAHGPQPTSELKSALTVHVPESVFLEEDVVIEPGAVIGPNVTIGTGTVVGPNAVIGANCRIGRNCHISSHSTVRNALIGDNVTIHDGARIGQDGFGFVPGPAGLEKMPQIGRVIIQNNVEIGANTTIDRGALDDTVIGEGTKIDNLVQIAHNVRIGRHCAIAAHGGISGSVTIGDGVLLGGRVGIADHISVGDGAQIAASSGVMNNVPPGEKWGGAPAKPIKMLFREFATLKALSNPPRKEK